MPEELNALILTAITIACLHTASGPDHYLPFIALSRARNWSFTRTISWTLLCGAGHVGSSVVLGLGGALLGWSMTKIQVLQSLRGGLAAWTLLGFGLIYLGYGLVCLRQNRGHKHFDIYPDGSAFVFEHRHGETVPPRNRFAVTPWVMFVIFVLGPCEPMIPLLSYPAARQSWWTLGLLVGIYTAVTLATMAGMVVLGYFGAGFFRTEKLEKYVHVLGGLTIVICGIGMVFLEW